MTSRRQFMGRTAAVIGAATVSRAAMGAVPEAPTTTSAAMQPPLAPTAGRPYNPGATLNGWTLPWRMNSGWKEFHLVAEPVVRELAPGMQVSCWGYNWKSPVPIMECVYGDMLNTSENNKLPEHTPIYWHGVIVPSGMDGVGGLTQPLIGVGKNFIYEFEMRKSCTVMYPPNA